MAVSYDHSIAIMGTGDELIQGDIVNSNGQEIAKIMHSHNMKPGIQLVVADEISAMVAALQFLLARHAVVITIGGLGPTSDDITRQAVAQALGVTLEFHQPSWQRLESRFNRLTLPLTDNNKQQCFFPTSSTILVNDHGSANGCIVNSGDKSIVMLPGPPRECLPMFSKQVLPVLLNKDCAMDVFRYRATLIEVSESAVADCLDALLDFPNIEIGYRCYYPYLDVKLSSDCHNDLQSVIHLFQQQYANHIISDNGQITSVQLQKRFIDCQLLVSFDDAVTAGLWQQKLVCPVLKQRLFWQGHSGSEEVDMSIKLRGLEQFWGSTNEVFDELYCDITLNKTLYSYQKSIRLRGKETLVAAVEWASYFCLQTLDKVK